MEKAVFDAVIGDEGSAELIHDWYRAGALENKRRGKQIDGLERLLKNLKTNRVERILIHGMVDDERQRYSVFTDEKVNELIGLLRYPVAPLKGQSPERIKKLKELVAESFGSSENPWISEVDAEKAVFDVAEADGLPLQGAQYIFARREIVNELRGNPIDGFECLLKNLDTTRAESVLIHKMTDDNGRVYRIFTDPEISELIGLLRFPI